MSCVESVTTPERVPVSGWPDAGIAPRLNRTASTARRRRVFEAVWWSEGGAVGLATSGLCEDSGVLRRWWRKRERTISFQLGTGIGVKEHVPWSGGAIPSPSRQPEGTLSSCFKQADVWNRDVQPSALFLYEGGGSSEGLRGRRNGRGLWGIHTGSFFLPEGGPTEPVPQRGPRYSHERWPASSPFGL